LHRATAAGVVMLVLALGAAGCSVVGPESSWSGNEGSLTGVVRSTEGYAIAGIDVTARAQTSEGDWVEYVVTTDAGGVYGLNGVELGQAHAYEKDYVLYVNRTAGSALPIVSGYGTWMATVPVRTSGTSCDVTIPVNSPGMPDEYIE